MSIQVWIENDKLYKMFIGQTRKIIKDKEIRKLFNTMYYEHIYNHSSSLHGFDLDSIWGVVFHDYNHYCVVIDNTDSEFETIKSFISQEKFILTETKYKSGYIEAYNNDHTLVLIRLDIYNVA